MASQVVSWTPDTLQPVFAQQCSTCREPLQEVYARSSPQYISAALMDLWRTIGPVRAKADYLRVQARNQSRPHLHTYHSCPICPITIETSRTVSRGGCACGKAETYSERGFSCAFCDKWLCGLDCYKAHAKPKWLSCLTSSGSIAVPADCIGRAWCPFCRTPSLLDTVKFRDDVYAGEMSPVEAIKVKVRALIKARKFRDACHRFTVHHRVCAVCRPLLTAQWAGNIPLVPLGQPTDHDMWAQFRFNLSDVSTFFSMPHAQCIRILRQPHLRFLQYVNPPYTRKLRVLFMAAGAEVVRLRAAARPKALSPPLWLCVESYVPEMWGQLLRFVEMGHHIDRTLTAHAPLVLALRN